MDDRLPAFRFDSTESLKQRCGVNFELQWPEQPAAHEGIEYRGYKLDGMAVLLRTMVAHGVVRDERHIRASQLDHYCLRVPQSPVVPQDGRAPSLAYSPVFADMAQPMRFQMPAGSDILIFVPREALDALLPRRLDLHGAVPDSSSGAVLGDFVRSMASRMDMLRTGEARALTQATLHMMAAALASQCDSLPLAPARADHLLVRRIRQFIDDHLADPDLSPARLCAAFRLSRSSLFRLLEPLGGPATCIRERRLARAHAMLTGTHRRVCLKRAAADCGFADASHFSRAFRVQYGYSPREALVRGPLSKVEGARETSSGRAAASHPFAGWLQALRA
jgi:AraC-like DNA-binding protein